MSIQSIHSLEVEVCAHEGVVQEEDLALLRFEHLALFAVDGLNERLAQNKLPLISVQLLQEKHPHKDTELYMMRLSCRSPWPNR